MKIEPGLYLTRDGRKARVLCVDAPGKQPVVGFTLITDTEVSTGTWGLDGSWSETGNLASADLISPWIDSPVVDWDAMPGWANWVAQCDNGEWRWFVAKPVQLDLGFSSFYGQTDYGIIPPLHCPESTGNWRDSLCERPK